MIFGLLNKSRIASFSFGFATAGVIAAVQLRKDFLQSHQDIAVAAASFESRLSKVERELASSKAAAAKAAAPPPSIDQQKE